MEALIALVVVVGLLVAVGILGHRYGVDSRASYPDDWARPVYN